MATNVSSSKLALLEPSYAQARRHDRNDRRSHKLAQTATLSEALTAEQEDDMLHALGLTKPFKRTKKAYRNHFVTSVGGVDDATWRELQAQGFAVGRTYPHAPDSNVYWVTDRGVETLGATAYIGPDVTIPKYQEVDREL